MKLILILTFFCVAQLTSNQAQALDTTAALQKQNPQVKAHAKMTREMVKETSRCIDDPKNPQLKCSKRTPVKRSQQEIIAQKNRPKLKPNQYSLSFDNKTTVFSTQIHQGLLLSQNCFKGKTPNCQAYTKSIETTNTKPQDNMKSPYHNNFGAIHCELMGGKGLIAKTSTNDDSDFCQFPDGSMVSSWSAYYKTHPQVQTK